MNRLRSPAALVVDRWPCPAGWLAAAGRAGAGVCAERSAGVDRRAASPVIGVVALVAMDLIVAATVGWAGLGFSEQIREPAPNVAESKGELKTQDGYDGGVVRITHVAGDSVSVRNIEIVVDVDAGDETGKARIVNFPSDYGSSDGQPFTDENLEGDDFIGQGGSADWDARVLHTDHKNTLEAGSWFEFRIKGATGIQLSSGDEVTVRVVHTPSQSIIIEQELTAS